MRRMTTSCGRVMTVQRYRSRKANDTCSTSTMTRARTRMYRPSSGAKLGSRPVCPCRHRRSMKLRAWMTGTTTASSRSSSVIRKGTIELRARTSPSTARHERLDRVGLAGDAVAQLDGPVLRHEVVVLDAHAEALLVDVDAGL